ncbi:MAG: hypothetical protein HJJLKODD_00360 [Phycisphaerae bacterium]|nr:hypothetical protein [Phycisphaerae bacterium]
MVRKSENQMDTSPQPVYLIAGADHWLRATRRRQLVQQLLGLDPGSESAVTTLPPDSSLAVVLDELRTVPMFSAYRVVIIDPADDLVSSYGEELERYMLKPSRTASLLMVVDKADGRTRLVKNLKNLAAVLECQPLEKQAMLQWIMQHAQECYHRKIQPQAAAELQRLIGDDHAQLDGELNKLSIYIGERPLITVEDVQALVGQHREEMVFRIVEYINQNRRADALQQWHQVWKSDRAASKRAVGGLAYQVRKYLETLYQSLQGKVPGNAHWMLGMSSDELRQWLKKTDPQRVENQLRRLFRADLESKNGVSNTLTAIEKQLIEMTG